MFIVHLHLPLIQLDRQQPPADLQLFLYRLLTLELAQVLLNSQFDIAVVVLPQFADQFAQVLLFDLLEEVAEEDVQKSAVYCLNVRQIGVELKQG